MLTRRTQILLDEKLWDTLSKRAKEENTSVGALIRKAASEKYQTEDEKAIIARRKKAYEEIIRIRPKPVKGKIDYKELINYGRKY